MNRKFAGISLFICLVVPVIALMLWTQHQKSEIRREVKRKLTATLDKEEMVLLRFTKEEAETSLHWKHSKEFEYLGSMYDIVQMEQHGDTTYYWCWWDMEETVLNKRLNELASIAFGKDPRQKENKKQLTSFFKTWFIDHAVSLTFKESMDNHAFPAYHKTYLSWRNSPPSPPPRLS